MCSTVTTASPWASSPTVTLRTSNLRSLTAHAGGGLDRLEGRVDRAVAGGRPAPASRPSPWRSADARAWRLARRVARRRAGSSRCHGRSPAELGPQHQRLDVAVEHSFFLSASALKSSNTRSSSASSSSKPSSLTRSRSACAAAVLAEHEVGARQAHVLGPHDLVGRVVLEHAVLVDARLVREGVLADDGLVARDRHAGDARRAGGWSGYRRCVSMPVCSAEERLARLERHHDLLERAVARALADAVDGALDLARAGPTAARLLATARPRSSWQCTLKVTLVDAAHVLAAGSRTARANSSRHRVADGVGDVDGRGAGLDHGLDDLARKSSSVREASSGENSTSSQRLARVAARLRRRVRTISLLRHVELVLAVDRAGGEEDVDARPLGVRARALAGLVDVLAVAAREARR